LQLNKYHARRGEHAAAATVKILAVQVQAYTEKSMQGVGWSCKQDKTDAGGAGMCMFTVLLYHYAM